MITSCSSQFAYRHLDWVILWYSDDYLDLSRQQENLFETELTQLLNWHAQSELPKYRLQLQTISTDLDTRPIPSALISQHVSAITDHWHNLRQHISKQLTPLVAKLTDSQVTFLFKQLEASNQERLADHLALTPDDIKERKLERFEDILIDWLGSINVKQAQLLYNLIDNQNDLTLDRIEYLRSYQAQLKVYMTPPIDQPALQALLNNPEPFQSPSYKNKQYANRQSMQIFIKEISLLLQPKQIIHLQEKLQEYISTINEILDTE
jgi:hypothetical protein